MKRYFEWLFPILRYLRLRREAPAWRAWASLLLACLVLIALMCARKWADLNINIAAILPQFKQQIVDWLINLALRYAFWTAFGVLAITTLELWAALLFVRHRPGRRRPRCTWQTIKFVLLGSRTWMILIVAGIGAIYLVDQYHLFTAGHKSETAFIWLLTGIFTVAAMAILLTFAATAVQAALAVIALQDDRRCEQCGYFLIGLTLPRCPECGTPFDPAKLAQMAAGLEQEREAGPK
jgi:hypothetical protein